MKKLTLKGCAHAINHRSVQKLDALAWCKLKHVSSLRSLLVLLSKSLLSVATCFTESGFPFW